MLLLFLKQLQICRNSKILIEENFEEKDIKIINLGIRQDAYNHTVLYQEGNLCQSVLEVCCKLDDGKDCCYITIQTNIVVNKIVIYIHVYAM